MEQATPNKFSGPFFITLMSDVPRDVPMGNMIVYSRLNMVVYWTYLWRTNTSTGTYDTLYNRFPSMRLRFFAAHGCSSISFGQAECLRCGMCEEC